MKINTSVKTTKALTLIEITLVISLLIGLSAFVTISVGPMQDWQKGRSAGAWRLFR